MPLVPKVKRKDKKKKAPPVAHFVTPAYKLAAAGREEVKSVCGTVVTGAAVPDAPICQACVLAQLEVDDKKSDNRVKVEAERGVVNANRQREAGKAEGVRQGRADSMREIREAAERRASEVKQVAS